MNQLLVPLNLRSKYKNILDYGISLALQSNSGLTIFFAAGYRSFTKDKDLEFQSDSDRSSLFEAITHETLLETVRDVVHDLDEAAVPFRFIIRRGSFEKGIVNEAASKKFDLLILGSKTSTPIRQYFQGELSGNIMGELNLPMIIVPASRPFSGIRHITYAVDLQDYDPNIIKQVKDLATLFDAKLTIVHVNNETESENEKYATSLAQTISDTIDYPKVYYKFFDHKDILSGIRKFVNQNDISLVAMINRKKAGWSGLFDKSLTRKMVQNLPVPLLAFKKYSA